MNRGRVWLAAAGAAVAAGMTVAGLRRATRGRAGWSRVNFRGTPVSLAGGPGVAAAASLGAAAAAATPRTAAAALAAGVGAGAFGLYDDLVGGRPEHRAKGFHGHLAALRQGRVTSGMTKLLGIGAASLAASALLPRRPGSPGGSVVQTLLGAGVIAGAANLFNLLDLRPGRALKVAALVGTPLAAGPCGGVAAAAVGAALGALPADLAERTMLGDCGANALGAVLGTALAARTGPVGRTAALAMIAGLTAASERISFTQVIAGQPVLRWLDELGRRPGPAPGAGPAAGDQVPPRKG